MPYREDPPRDEFLLKLFFANEAGPEVAIAHVRRFQESNRQSLTMLETIEAISQPHGSQFPGYSYWMLTLGYGLAHIRAVLAWSDTCPGDAGRQAGFAGTRYQVLVTANISPIFPMMRSLNWPCARKRSLEPCRPKFNRTPGQGTSPGLGQPVLTRILHSGHRRMDWTRPRRVVHPHPKSHCAASFGFSSYAFVPGLVFHMHSFVAEVLKAL